MLELLIPRRVRSFEAVRREEVEKLVVAIKDLSVANLSELMLSLANNVVCRVVLGDEFGDHGYSGKGGAHLHQLLSETQSLLGGFCVADIFPGMEWVDRLRGFHGRLDKNFEEMDTFINRIINEHLKKGKDEEESDDSAKDDGKEKNLVHALLTLHKDAVLRGGFLSNIDHGKAILVDELKHVINENTHRLIQESELEKLEYLKQVIKESLRLKPPLPLLLPRETIQQCEIQGYIIPSNTRAIFNAPATSTDPNI